MSEETELGETVQNLIRWCNVSTKVVLRTKLLTGEFIKCKNFFLQKITYLKMFKKIPKKQVLMVGHL